MSIPSGRQLLVIGRFEEYLLASGALVVQTCGDIHELNIEIVIVESIWDFKEAHNGFKQFPALKL